MSALSTREDRTAARQARLEAHAKRCTELESLYEPAVKRMVQLASGDTSSALPAAQVLLSTYNGSEWQLDVTDLCHMDPPDLDHALVVIRARVVLCTEPHTLIKDGGTIFHRLWNQWNRYHVNNRGKGECWTCNGRGEMVDHSTCPECEGTGLVARDRPTLVDI